MQLQKISLHSSFLQCPHHCCSTWRCFPCQELLYNQMVKFWATRFVRMEMILRFKVFGARYMLIDSSVLTVNWGPVIISRKFCLRLLISFSFHFSLVFIWRKFLLSMQLKVLHVYWKDLQCQLDLCVQVRSHYTRRYHQWSIWFSSKCRSNLYTFLMVATWTNKFIRLPDRKCLTCKSVIETNFAFKDLKRWQRMSHTKNGSQNRISVMI